MGLFNLFQKKGKDSVSKIESKTSLINEVADALRQNNNEKIKSLIEQIDNINEKDMYGNPLLNIAAENGNIEAVQVLLNAGADTESTDNYWGRTALIGAEKNEHIEVVELLKNANANNLYSDSISGGEYILACAKSGNLIEIKKLIESGANIEQRDSSDNTPLIVATYSGHKDIVELLIKAGANIDGQGEGGYTALILAVIYGYTEMVRVLLDAGADKSVTIQGGATAFSKAQDENNEEIISMLNKIQNPVDSNSGSSVNNEEANIGNFTDSRDGKVYKTVKIGNQIWFAENLKFESNESSWWYENSEDNSNLGLLYTRSKALKIVPSGWRLPTKSEFEELLNFLGDDEEDINKKLLESNETGFGINYSGVKYDDGNFYGKDEYSYLWSSTEDSEGLIWFLITTNDGRAYLNYSSDEGYKTKLGFAIRCILDD